MIKNYMLRKITAGQHDANCTMRKSDKVRSLMAAVQQQAATLKAKSGGQS